MICDECGETMRCESQNIVDDFIEEVWLCECGNVEIDFGPVEEDEAG